MTEKCGREHITPGTYAGHMSISDDNSIIVQAIDACAVPRPPSKEHTVRCDWNASNAEADISFMVQNAALDVYVIFAFTSTSHTYTIGSNQYFTRICSIIKNTTCDILVYTYIGHGTYEELLFSPTESGTSSTVESEYLVNRILQRSAPRGVGFSCANGATSDVVEVISAFPSSKWSVTSTHSAFVSTEDSEHSAMHRIMYWTPLGSCCTRALGSGVPTVTIAPSWYRGKLYTYHNLMRGKPMEDEQCLECNVVKRVHDKVSEVQDVQTKRTLFGRITRSARIFISQ